MMETSAPRWTLVRSLAALRETHARFLWLQDVPDLEDLAPFGDRTDLEGLRIVLCPRFASLRGIGRMAALESLDVSHCAEIDSLEPIAELTRLRELTLFGPKRLTTLRGIEGLCAPAKLTIDFCPALTDIDALHSLSTLTSLSLAGSQSLRELTPLAGLPKLESLQLDRCKSITSLEGLEPLSALESLDLTGCESLESIRALGDKPRLKKLVLDAAPKLRSLDGLQRAPALVSLSAASCMALDDIDALREASELTQVNLSAACSLRDVDALATLPRLAQLDLGYTNVESPPRLPRTLRKLIVSGTPMKSLACLEGCDELEELSLESTAIESDDEIRRGLASPYLRRISLSGTHIVPVDIGAVGYPAWIEQARAYLAPDRSARSQRWIGRDIDDAERAAFRRVIEAPSSRQARSEYAALLRARGEVRGEFIEADLVTMEDPFAPRPDRVRTLLRSNQAEWFGELWPFVRSWTCGGGFVHAATLRIRDAARHGPWLVEHTPLRALTLADSKGDAASFSIGSSDWTRSIESITYLQAPAGALECIGRSDHLHALRMLRCDVSRVSAEAAHALASGALDALRDLHLAGATFEPGAIRALVSLPLHVLDLSQVAVSLDDLLAIAGSPAMGSLRRLLLDGRYVPHAAIEAFAASEHLGALEEINLSGSDYDNPSPSPAPLFRSSALRSLRMVVTDAYWSTDPCGDFAVETPHGPAIHRVYAGNNY